MVRCLWCNKLFLRELQQLCHLFIIEAVEFLESSSEAFRHHVSSLCLYHTECAASIDYKDLGYILIEE